jgi:hypothetical protein
MLKVLIRHITASGLEKTYYIVVVTHCTDGTQLLPLLIFKRKIMSSDKIPRGIYIHILVKVVGWSCELSLLIQYNLPKPDPLYTRNLDKQKINFRRSYFLCKIILYFPVDNARVIYAKTFSKLKKTTVRVIQ